MSRVSSGIGYRVIFLSVTLFLFAQSTLHAQIPGLNLPTTPAPATGDGQPATVKEKPKAAVTPAGPITVKQQVPDHSLERFLRKFLPKYPGRQRDRGRRR